MSLVHLSAPVAAALEAGKPVVALESTIITHGLPRPQNLEVARRIENTVRENGAEPATIAVLEGRLCVGLDDAQLEWLADAERVAKLSRADMAVCMAEGRTGATTVAATMIAARMAGIEVFATGGIGGVHRGAEQSFDVSADLQELARSPVTVVAAGAKAILDLPKTLEVLETLGVPVMAYGQDMLPAFWSRSAGLRAPLRMDSPGVIARAHRMRREMALDGGQLVANPIPEDAEIPRAEMTPMISRAMQDAADHGITGKEVTPYLLQRIYELSEGRSLEANVALVLNNAALGARIAAELVAERP
ncbi:pseudouridine-5'-phosphate glycosidase [Roseivivax sp.]